MIIQVRSNHFMDITLFIILIKLLQSICKQAKRSTNKYTICIPVFQLFCHIQHALAGRNHIINNDHILAGYRVAQELMSNDRVFTIYNGRIITTFVEHTHINTKNIGEIYSSCHSTFIRADDHQMFVVDLQIRYGTKQRFQELISRHEIIKTGQRNCILYTRIMSVESDNIGNTHTNQLLQSHCTVQRFTFAAFMLSSFIQERHNNVDTVSFSCSSSDDTFQILEMIIRRHMIFITIYFISDTVVGDIAKNEKIHSTDRFVDDTFCFTGTETRAVTVNKERFLCIS